jgi:hypothetical protein
MLLALHSGLRYLFLMVGAAAVGYAVYGAATKRPFDETMRKLGGFFALSLHANLLVGVGILFTGQFYPGLAGHILMMAFAAVVAQTVPSVMRRRPMEERTYLPYVVSTVLAVAIVWAGLLAIGRQLV